MKTFQLFKEATDEGDIHVSGYGMLSPSFAKKNQIRYHKEMSELDPTHPQYHVHVVRLAGLIKAHGEALLKHRKATGESEI